MIAEYYAAHGANNDSQYEPSVQEAARTVCKWARDSLYDEGEWDEDGGYMVTVEIGRAQARTRDVTDADEDEWARLRGYEELVEDVVFDQVMAAVPTATMRRALAIVEQHDADLAAELRASLVQP